MPLNINEVLGEVEQISAAADPWSQLNTYLRLLASDPAAVAQLARTSPNTLQRGVRTLLSDLINPGSQFANAPIGPTSLRAPIGSPRRGLEPHFTPLLPPVQTGKATAAQAAQEARRITLRSNPGQRDALRYGLLSNPFALGAIRGTRGRNQGHTRRNPLGQSQFSRLGEGAQQQLQGEASAFGLGRNAFMREILGNTPASRGQQQVNPSYRRI